MANGITPPKTTPSGSRGGAGQWISQHKGVVIGGSLGVGVLFFLWMRSRSQAAASQQTSGQQSTVYPGSTGVQGSSNFGDYYAGVLNAIQSSNQNLSSSLTNLGSSLTTSIDSLTSKNNPGNSPTSPSTPSAGGAGSQPGYGIVQTAQGPMVWLGVNQAGAGIYNVGGGAPVYFGNASALAQGSQYEKAGEDIYTPASYADLVAKQAQPITSPYTG